MECSVNTTQQLIETRIGLQARLSVYPTRHIMFLFEFAQSIKAAYSVTFDRLILELMFLVFKNTVKKLKFRYILVLYQFRKS